MLDHLYILEKYSFDHSMFACLFSLCSSGCPRIHSVDQAEIHLPLPPTHWDQRRVPPLNTGINGMRHLCPVIPMLSPVSFVALALPSRSFDCSELGFVCGVHQGPQLHSFAYGYAVVSALFMEKTAHFPFKWSWRRCPDVTVN